MAALPRSFGSNMVPSSPRNAVLELRFSAAPKGAKQESPGQRPGDPDALRTNVHRHLRAGKHRPRFLEPSPPSFLRLSLRELSRSSKLAGRTSILHDLGIGFMFHSLPRRTAPRRARSD